MKKIRNRIAVWICSWLCPSIFRDAMSFRSSRILNPKEEGDEMVDFSEYPTLFLQSAG